VLLPEIERHNIPPVLYHYTDAKGLLGIVGNHSLWFTDVHYLNDMSERRWGLEVIRSQLSAYADKMSDVEKDMISRVFQELEVNSLLTRAAVFCMCEKDNLLNQWRDYGDDVVPYSIGLDSGRLASAQSFNFSPVLIKVIYVHEDQIRLADELIKVVFEVFWKVLNQYENLSEADRHLVVQHAASQLTFPLYWFKNPGFEAEHEWRLVREIGHIVSSGNATQWRAGSYGLTPYYEWGPSAKQARLPIVSSTVGPSHYPDIATDALRMMMDSKGYSDVHIMWSDIPLRR